MTNKLDEAVSALRGDVIETLRRWIRIPSEERPAEEGAPFGRPLRQMLTVALEDGQHLT